MTVLSAADKLKRRIQYGINDSDTAEQALDLLARVDISTATQEQIIARWPHLIARMIVESDNYFGPRKAANAVMALKMRRSFGCEFYCYLAGFETNGWPQQPEYDRLLKNAGELFLRRAFRLRHRRPGASEQAAGLVAAMRAGQIPNY